MSWAEPNKISILQYIPGIAILLTAFYIVFILWNFNAPNSWKFQIQIKVSTTDKKLESSVKEITPQNLHLCVFSVCMYVNTQGQALMDDTCFPFKITELNSIYQVEDKLEQGRHTHLWTHNNSGCLHRTCTNQSISQHGGWRYHSPHPQIWSYWQLIFLL